ncbi:MAG: HepT-like ribonuclease domain-containing protein, partial [Flavobacteriales bacterium]
QLVQDAVERRLEIIAEASKHIPDQLRAAHSLVPWRTIKDMRNIIAHEYFGVQLVFIWRTVSTDLDDLELACQAMLIELGEG